MDKVFGWESEEVRYSWATVRELLEKNKDGVKVDWYPPAIFWIDG